MPRYDWLNQKANENGTLLGPSRVKIAAMKCAIASSTMLAFFAILVILVTFSDAGRSSIRSRATSALHGIANVATGVLNRLGCKASRIELLPHPLKWPPISESDMEDDGKWKAAVRSKDPARLENMLKLCRNHEGKYAESMYKALVAAHLARKWDNYTKIIEAMCISPDLFKSWISHVISRAVMCENDLCLVAIAKGIAGKKPKMDWQEGEIEMMTKIIFDVREYHTLGLLLEMGPSNKGKLRRLAVRSLYEEILSGNIDSVNELVRIFDISATEIYRALKKAVRICIGFGSTKTVGKIIKFLDNATAVHNALRDVVGMHLHGAGQADALDCIFHFLDNKPQLYKHAVRAALKKFTREDIAKLGRWSSKCRKMIKKWATKGKSCQKEEGNKMRKKHFHLCYPRAKSQAII